ncbi:ABC transporter B family member 21 [Zea mays]|uniref:ABC transporter B family member 21 n=1 Tax=Zea mays TaxID=4577 RepID=A0A1D6MRB2_MAIZE|nr:ABC transporter B family member 21 [Zea mays]
MRYAPRNMLPWTTTEKTRRAPLGTFIFVMMLSFRLKCHTVLGILGGGERLAWHLHFRDDAVLQAAVPHSARHFGRDIIMPNLKSSVATTASAVEYRDEVGSLEVAAKAKEADVDGIIIQGREAGGHVIGQVAFSVFAGVGERTREGNDLYKEIIESVVIKLGDKQVKSVIFKTRSFRACYGVLWFVIENISFSFVKGFTNDL